MTPVDYGDVCVNTDDAWFASHQPAAPTTLADLDEPGVQGPARRREPGDVLARAGVPARHDREVRRADGWQTYWTGCSANGVKVDNGWTERLRRRLLRARGKGDRPLVVSYGTDPAGGHRLRRRPQADHARTSRVMTDGCFRQVEFAGCPAPAPSTRPRRGRSSTSCCRPRSRRTCRCRCTCSRREPTRALPEVFRQWTAKPLEPAVAPAGRHHREPRAVDRRGPTSAALTIGSAPARGSAVRRRPWALGLRRRAVPSSPSSSPGRWSTSCAEASARPGSTC